MTYQVMLPLLCRHHDVTLPCVGVAFLEHGGDAVILHFLAIGEETTWRIRPDTIKLVHLT